MMRHLFTVLAAFALVVVAYPTGLSHDLTTGGQREKAGPSHPEHRIIFGQDTIQLKAHYFSYKWVSDSFAIMVEPFGTDSFIEGFSINKPGNIMLPVSPYKTPDYAADILTGALWPIPGTMHLEDSVAASYFAGIIQADSLYDMLSHRSFIFDSLKMRNCTFDVKVINDRCHFYTITPHNFKRLKRIIRRLKSGNAFILTGLNYTGKRDPSVSHDPWEVYTGEIAWKIK